MKKYNIDHLFKQKLQGHTTAPSAQAWEQLSQQLPPAKGQKTPYWWAAAAIALLLISGWFLLTQQAQPAYPETTLASHPSETSPIQDAAVGEPEFNPSIPEPEQENPNVALAQQESSPKVVQKNPSQTGKPAAKTQSDDFAPAVLPTQQLPKASELILASLPATRPAVDARPVSLSSISTETSEKIIIEYKASKPLIAKADAPASTMTPKKDESTVLKVWEEVKHANVGLADLRSAKNNLFARLTTRP